MNGEENAGGEETSSPRGEGGQYRADLADRRTTMAEERTRMARERTFTAWIRTGIAATAAGVGITRLFQETELLSLFIGLGFVTVGGLLYLFGLWRYCQEAPRRDPEALPMWLLYGIVAMLLFASVLGFVMLVRAKNEESSGGSSHSVTASYQGPTLCGPTCKGDRVHGQAISLW